MYLKNKIDDSPLYYNFKIAVVGEGEQIMVDQKIHVDDTLKKKIDLLNEKGSLFERKLIWQEYLKSLKEKQLIEILSPNFDTTLKKKYGSSHNYFINILFDFGLISLALVIFSYIYLFKKIIFKNIDKIFKYKNQLLIFGFLMASNFFKVPLIQPFPGIIMFFFLGYFYSLLLNNSEKYNK